MQTGIVHWRTKAWWIGLWRGEVEEGRGLTADSCEGGEPFCIYIRPSVRSDHSSIPLSAQLGWMLRHTAS